MSEEVKPEVNNLTKQKNSKEEKTTILNPNEIIQNMGLVNHNKCVYQIIFYQYDSNGTKVILLLLWMDWDYASK